MKVLLLTAAIEPVAVNLQLDVSPFADNLLDWQIQQLLALRLEPVIMTDRRTDEALLRRCRHVDMCELAFDTDDDPDFTTQLRAGLHATQRESFVLPVSVPCPPAAVWESLQTHFHLRAAPGTDFVRPFCPIAGELFPGFPLLITRSGRQKMQEKGYDLHHPQLQISRAPVLESAITRVVNTGVFSPSHPGLDS